MNKIEECRDIINRALDALTKEPYNLALKYNNNVPNVDTRKYPLAYHISIGKPTVKYAYNLCIPSSSFTSTRFMLRLVDALYPGDMIYEQAYSYYVTLMDDDLFAITYLLNTMISRMIRITLTNEEEDR